MKMKTPYQRLAVVKEANGNVLVYGDGYVMFGTTEDDDIWADAMVHPPMAVSTKKRHILMIGGGGGITTREVLRYPQVKSVTVVDIDSAMVVLSKIFSPLVKFNRRSLNNRKVRCVIKDGRAYVEKKPKKWDAVIIDIPEPSYDAPALSRLFSVEFYRLLKKRLRPGGAVTIACSVMSDMPEYCWSIVATLQAAGFHVLPYHFDVLKKYGEDWGYCVAATRPITPADIDISIPTRFLTPARLKDMFRIPRKYMRKWRLRKIQTDRNTVLADIHERYNAMKRAGRTRT
jgi:spermidine synthase